MLRTTLNSDENRSYRCWPWRFILVTCGKVLILIDSGPKNFKVRKNVIDRLKGLLDGRAIDIAVVTHNDDDHIGGYKYILDSDISIKKFIFNSLSYISKILKVKSDNKQISYQQDIDLDKLLKELNIEALALNASDKAIWISIQIIYCNKIREKQLGSH